MIVQRVIGGVVAIAAMAAAAGVVVVAAAFAVYTLLRDYLGPAGSAAVIAAAFAVLLAVGALVMFGRAKGPKVADRPKAKSRAPEGGISGRIFEMLRDRPVVAAGAAVAAGLLAWRNPQLVGTIMRAFGSKPDRD